MKTKFLLTVVTAMVLAGCKPTPSSPYEVKGILSDSSYDGKTLYIQGMSDGRNIDSTVVTGRDFVFKGAVGTAELCRINAKPDFATFILEKGVIEIDFKKHRGSPTTPLNAEYNKLMDAGESMYERISAKAEEFSDPTDDPEEAERLRAEYFEKTHREIYLETYRTFFLSNPDNPVGAVALLQYSQAASTVQTDELIARAGKTVLSYDFVQELIKRNDALKNTAVGKPFADFSVDQGDGTTASLSDYVGKGKYVLVDFWASWCGPCIREIPVIAEMYEKYGNMDFEVLGVAVWDDPGNTREAIEKYGMTWPQILNAQSVPTDLYGIAGIPHIILFAPDGTIAARELRGEGLKAKVAEVMAKN